MKYTDPDGRISGIQDINQKMNNYNDVIGNQDKRTQIYDDTNTPVKNRSYIRINGYGCVLTMFARLASTIAGFSISPSDLNSYARDNNIFELDTSDGWGDITLLSLNAGVSIVNSVLKERGIKNLELELVESIPINGETDLNSILEPFDNDLNTIYLYGMRLDDKHSISLSRDYSNFDPKHPRENNKKYKRDDTSNRTYSSVNYSNPTWIYIFKIKQVEADEN